MNKDKRKQENSMFIYNKEKDNSFSRQPPCLMVKVESEAKGSVTKGYSLDCYLQNASGFQKRKFFNKNGSLINPWDFAPFPEINFSFIVKSAGFQIVRLKVI